MTISITERKVRYEYLQVPIRNLNRGPISSSEPLLFTLNMYAPQGWHLVDRYEVTSDNNGSYADQFTYLDGETHTFIGIYKVILLEREIHEFRTPA